MTTRRDRVMDALNFRATDRLPKDLGAMASTGISCFAYPKLVAALGLKPRLPRVYDTMQMLALPDTDVLDALDCDVATVFWGVTNAYPEPRKWKPYDFNGRLPARVRSPKSFRALSDGTIEQPRWEAKMPPTAYFFNGEHAGQGLDFMETGDLGLKDLKKLRREVRKHLPKPADVRKLREMCERARGSTDRAIFYNGPGQAEIAISAHGGMGVFPIICMMHPDYVAEYHDIMVSATIEKIETVLPEVAPFIDVMITGGDDWGTQQSPIASPDVFHELFLPYYRRINDTAHRIKPGLKTFLHSCGAIYDLIDDIIACGFDILNPVQWTAGSHSYQDWKAKARGRIALWGGGVNSQHTLALGSAEEVEREVADICAVMREGAGYVFNPIHNMLAETTPDKIIAMYRTASRF
jgi:uroporphyrinogen decarboxylase